MRNYSDYYELTQEEMMLSSGGETEDFNKMQKDFNKMFEGIDDEDFDANPVDEDSDLWCYENITDTTKGKKVFLDEVAKIRQISSYKSILIFLLLRNRLAIGKKNIEGLWDYVQDGKPKFKSKISEKKEEAFRQKLKRECGEEPGQFDAADYEMLLTILFVHLKEEYEQNGCEEKKNWKSYFRDLLFSPKEIHIHELALGYQMDEKLFRVFRKKILKYSGINFFDREQILLYFVIRYAKVCGEYKYFDAYRKLKEKYPVEEIVETVKEKQSTLAIRNDLLEHLEEEGELKQKYRETFFCKESKDETIVAVLRVIDSMNRADRVRTAEKLFKKLWDKFESALENSAEADAILEFLDRTGDDVNAAISYKRQFGKQNVYRWLYGTKVNKREVREVVRRGKKVIQARIVDLPDEFMQVLGEGREEFFLDSKLFLETRIRDNTFSAFPVDEERQRNLLLTVVFLNFVFNKYNLGDYEERVEDFDIMATDILADCGFQLMHSGNAYDAYLKLLLSCDMPLELFRYVWKLKTFSEE